MFTTIFVEPLFNLLFVLYGFLPGHDLGVAVIGLTVIVRLLLWPLVTRQLHSQRIMQSLAPEVAKVRQKAGGDRQKETQMLMELYKERGTSPFAPLLPLLVQLPIFFALYLVFKDAVDPDKIASLTYDAVERIPAVARVLADHSLFSPTLFNLVDLTKPNVLIAILAGAAQWYQAKMLQPKKTANMDAQARMMSSLINVFPVVTIVIGMTLPSALALYWAVTSVVAVIQQHIVLRRDATEMEDAADKRESSSKTKAVAATAKPETTTETVDTPANPKTARKRARKGGRKGGAK